MTSAPALVRAGNWWNHKVPPIVAVAALALDQAGRPRGWPMLADLALYLCSTVGVAAFGHVVNDLADLSTDRRAGVENRMDALTWPTRLGVLTATLVVGLAPWVWLPRPREAIALLAAELALLVAYSCRPIRLKNRSVLGAAADASFASLLPLALTAAVFTAATDRRSLLSDPRSVCAVGLSGLFVVSMGWRGILWHQLDDIEHDRRAGVNTVATRFGSEAILAVVSRTVVVEVVALTVAIGLAASAGRLWVGILWLAYVPYRLFQATLLWSPPFRAASLRDQRSRVHFVGYVIVNDFVERWLPVAAVVALAVEEPVAWLMVGFHLAAFDNFVIDVRRDIPGVPDAATRLAHAGTRKRQIAGVRERRLERAAGGPAQVDPGEVARHRWVFVVCGPVEHIETLRTAVSHLRPLTNLEIWVVTDRSRNRAPIVDEGVDRVVDVATPRELDDHQASIWLKTSLHRHLPDGEWCYLDSDLIAVRPGMETVFEHRLGPVAFASDLTIAENCVDRFSPWAMTCECSGRGDAHSCSHLREQLRARFGVDVPGDWLHWNGGLFVFGADSAEFLDNWHESAVASFGWPEWRTRDQGTLIATAWALGLADCPRVPQEFNFIADLGNGDLCLDSGRGWALRRSGPWLDPWFLHLYTCRLDDPTWDLSDDVEAVVITQTVAGGVRWRRRSRWQRVPLAFARLRWNLRRLRPARMKAGMVRRLRRRFEMTSDEDPG